MITSITTIAIVTSITINMFKFDVYLQYQHGRGGDHRGRGPPMVGLY